MAPTDQSKMSESKKPPAAPSPSLRAWLKTHWRGLVAAVVGLGSLLPCVVLIYAIAYEWYFRLGAPWGPKPDHAAGAADFMSLANGALAIALLIIFAGFVVCAIVLLLQLKRSDNGDDDPGRRDLSGIWGSVLLVVLGVVLACVTLKYAHEHAPHAAGTHASRAVPSDHCRLAV